MIRWIGCAFLVLGCLGCGSGDPSEQGEEKQSVTVDEAGQEALLNAMVDVVKRQVAILATVVDEASSEAAVEKLAELAKEAKVLLQRSEEMGRPSDALVAKIDAEMREVMRSYEEEMTRIMNIPEVADHLDELMENVELNR